MASATLVAQSPSRSGLPQAGRGGRGGFTSPAPVMTEGKSIESRAPEKTDDKPLVAGQTGAPYHATSAPVVKTLTDQLRNPWSPAFLPDGDPLIEKPGTMRVVDKNNAFSEPVRNVPAVAAIGQEGLLDVALDPAFTTNRRIFIHLQRSCRRRPEPDGSGPRDVCEAGNALNDVNVFATFEWGRTVRCTY
jgi:Glucose / Sorbosone dehydrogenase